MLNSSGLNSLEYFKQSIAKGQLDEEARKLIVQAYDETKLKCMLKCVFSLSEEEAQVLAYLIRRGTKAIVKDIASELGRNPEVVRRALRRLHAKSLVVRRPYPLRKGGRAYVYEVPKEVTELVINLCEYARTATTLVLRSSTRS
jgi:predicted transcriptional regulator